jgi:formylglycine-generating enzyme required for sulfatase activity
LVGWNGSQDASDFRKFVEDVAAIVGFPITEVKSKTRAQRTAEKDRLGEQERQWLAKGTRPKADEALEKLLKFREGAISKPITVFRDKLKDGSEGPEMIIVPAGEFQMGLDGYAYLQPVHTVRIRTPFAIGKYEVTFEWYDRFAAATGRELPDDSGWGRGQRPVMKVSWDDAVEYGKWLSAQTGERYRLPSEAEWEYAAGSGETEEKWAGISLEQYLDEHGWHATNSAGKTQPVGLKKPNRFGLFDMTGNVSEWVQDWWHRNYDGAPTDERPWLQGEDLGRRVVRGSSWDSERYGLKSKNIRELSSSRGMYSAVYRSNTIGFRVARNLD